MLELISPSDAQRVRDFLAQAGFESETLRKVGIIFELPSSRLRNMPRLLDSTREPTLLNTLLRWFWIGVPQDADTVALAPAWFVDLCLTCGLLRKDGNEIAAEAMLFPGEDFISICDHSSRIDARDPEFVLWPNPTSKLLSRFTIRRHSRATLDLGTGNAMQAIQVARHSDRVIATDLNPRAVAYAKFSARLNGFENIECLLGDGFAPVAGQKFDLIVSNPPFFITPSDHYFFCDNPMDLDQLCRQFVKQASEMLNEGGYFQLLCEWAQIGDQGWQERVAEWLEGTGCDAWVIKGQTQDVALYAQQRIAENVVTPQGDAALFDSYMAYYRQRNVTKIHDGVIALRKRSGKNWVLLEEVADSPKDSFGDSVLSLFEGRDFLNTHDADADMLAIKPRLVPHARLEQFFQPGNGRWEPTTLNLRLTKGMPFFVGLQAPVAGFLSDCDGTHTVGDLIAEFAKRVEAPFEQVQKECLGIIRRLVERGFLTW